MAAKPQVYRVKGKPAVYGARGKPAVFLGRGATPTIKPLILTAGGIGAPALLARKEALATPRCEGTGFPQVEVLNRNIEARGIGSPEVAALAHRHASVQALGRGTLFSAASGARYAEAQARGVGSSNINAITDLNFLQMIQAAGADSGLNFCLDAASDLSYNPGGAWSNPTQRWRDLTGQGNDFWRGSSSSSQSSDPTFNGTVGGLSANEYFSSDGDDIFQETAEHTFAETWHKDNAAFSIVCVLYLVSPGANIFANNGGGANGIIFSAATGTQLTIAVSESDPAPSGQVLLRATSAKPSANAIGFYAVALDETVGANGVTLQINTTREKFTSTYSSPGTLGSFAPYRFGRVTTQSLASGTRFYVIAGWSRRLSDTELDAIYAQLKARYTSLP